MQKRSIGTDFGIGRTQNEHRTATIVDGKWVAAIEGNVQLCFSTDRLPPPPQTTCGNAKFNSDQMQYIEEEVLNSAPCEGNTTRTYQFTAGRTFFFSFVLFFFFTFVIYILWISFGSMRCDAAIYEWNRRLVRAFFCIYITALDLVEDVKKKNGVVREWINRL